MAGIYESAMNEDQLKQITARKDYGIIGSSRGITGGIKSGFKREAILHKTRGERAVPELEPSSGPQSFSAQALATPNSRRCIIGIKVFRKRLTDTGNDCWKYHIDACRYIGWLSDDNDAKVQITEEPHIKVETDAEERVEITLTYQDFDIKDLVEYYKDGPKNQGLPP